MAEFRARESICEVGRRLWQRDLIGAAEGNISIRLDDDRLLSTPTGVSKGHLTPTDLVVVAMDGNVIGAGTVSSEIRLHLGVYRARADVRAVVHAHPITATSLTLVDMPLPDDIVPEGTVILGPVATVPFAMPGTDDVPDGLLPYLPNHDCLLLSNHGAVTLGTDVMEACYRMETLERVARMYVTARMLGEVHAMPADAYAELAARRHA